MKKLMIAATLTLAAVALQAADIKWGARSIYIPVAKDAAVSETGIIPTSGNKFGDTGMPSLTVSLFWLDNDKGEHKIKDLTTTGAGLIAQATLGNSSTDTALYTAMLAEGNNYLPNYYFTASYNDGKGTYTYTGNVVATTPIGNLPNGNIALWADFTKTGSWSYEAAAVPEPTSGLLLLLGVAGLALRRRRA